MVSTRHSGSKWSSFRPLLGHCVVFLGKTLYSHSQYLSSTRCINGYQRVLLRDGRGGGSLHAKETGKSSGLMGNLAHMQTWPASLGGMLVSTYLFNWVERGFRKVECLAQNHKEVPHQGLKAGQIDPAYCGMRFSDFLVNSTFSSHTDEAQAIPSGTIHCYRPWQTPIPHMSLHGKDGSNHLH